MNKMIKSLIGVGLVSFGFLCAQGASAAKFDAKDVSNTKLQCGVMGNPNWCYGYPEGTVNVTITPDQLEDVANVTDVYIVATYQGQHYTYNPRTTDPEQRWELFPSDGSPIAATFSRAPFDGLSLSRPLYLGKFAKVKGIDIYVGVAPSKGKVFSIATLKKVWSTQ